MRQQLARVKESYKVSSSWQVMSTNSHFEQIRVMFRLTDKMQHGYLDHKDFLNGAS